MKKVVLLALAFGLVILNGTQASAESAYQTRARIVSSLYENLLDRPRHAIHYSEISYWVDYSFKQPLFSVAHVERALLNSDERFVAQAYRNILKRVGDQGGIQFYTSQVRNRAMTQQQVVELFKRVCSQRINGECS